MRASHAMMTVLCLTLTAPAAVNAQQLSKEQDCAYQAAVAAAVKDARMDRVPEEKLAEHITGQSPDWPERYNNAIPILGGAIYQVDKKQLSETDIGAQWMEMCMSQ